ncbi:hypothetical protein [Paractinoplanes durhamensis]|uniref:hypothetical protein n=1 Tax=Paractinoplanes durhamensis TaxID=113563 RepID=UPI00362BB67E
MATNRPRALAASSDSRPARITGTAADGAAIAGVAGGGWADRSAVAQRPAAARAATAAETAHARGMRSRIDGIVPVATVCAVAASTAAGTGSSTKPGSRRSAGMRPAAASVQAAQDRVCRAIRLRQNGFGTPFQSATTSASPGQPGTASSAATIVRPRSS